MAKAVAKVPRGSKITPMQQAFIDHLLADPKMIGTQAALKAGCPEKSAHVTASKWLKLPKIQAAIDAAKATRVKRVLTKQDRVLRQMLAVSESDMRDVATWAEGGVEFKPSAELSPRAASAVQAVKSKRKIFTDKDGNTEETVEMEVKLHPKVPMIRTLAEHLGMMPSSKIDVTVNQPMLVIGDPRGWAGAAKEHEEIPTIKAKMIESPRATKKKRRAG